VSDFDPPEEPDIPPPLMPVQEKKLGYLLIAFLIGLAFSVPLYLVAYARGSSRIQSEAVKAKHAEYKVVDEFGHTRFEWLPVPGIAEKK